MKCKICKKEMGYVVCCTLVFEVCLNRKCKNQNIMVLNKKKSKKKMKIWIILMIGILLATLVYQSVSAYEIYCIDGDSGMRIWEKGEVTDEKREAIGQLLDSETFVNCTLIMNETENEFTKCQQFFDPVINYLNGNIKLKNAELKQKKNANYFLLGMIGLIVIINIINHFRLQKFFKVDSSYLEGKNE